MWVMNFHDEYGRIERLYIHGALSESRETASMQVIMVASGLGDITSGKELPADYSYEMTCCCLKGATLEGGNKGQGLYWWC